jgi:hypothetical protein
MINVEQLATAVISAFVALVVAGITAGLTLIQERRERKKWLTDVKVAWSLELHKARMATYAEVHKALFPLSRKNPEKLTPEIAGRVAHELNLWLHSAGGLFADATTRGALVRLRDCCFTWSDGGEEPSELYTRRDLMTTFLRRDLDVLGLDSYDFNTDSTAISKLQEEFDQPRRTGLLGRLRVSRLTRGAQRSRPLAK